LEVAAQLAATSGLERNFRLFALAVRNDGALVGSPNGNPSFPDVRSHAEIRALRKSGRDALLFVARIDRADRWALARPCKLCLPLLKHRGVLRCYYTISPGEYGVLTF
jgi:tRNA(Arg) A34 adenosine deaminase TadA